MTIKAQVIAEACEALSKEGNAAAARLIARDYPFAPIQPARRSYTARQSLEIFQRDGFIDRYSGERLVFPPVLRVLSGRLPEVFPFRSNWKMDQTHLAYWELFPTIDHIVPVARGGPDEPSNRVTTSQLHNSAKSNWTLGELGWRLLPPGSTREWDGLVGWFLRYVREHPAVLNSGYIRMWHRAAVSA